MMLLFFALWLAVAIAHDIVPGRMIDVRSAGGGLLELQVSMGTPPRDVRLAADMTLGSVVLGVSPLDSSFSATLTPVGYSDLLHIGNKHFMFPLSVDYQRVAEVCPSCNGLLGLGGSSPLWTFWRSVRLSLSGLRLQEEPLTEGARCSQPDPQFCNTTGTVYVGDHTHDVRVLFSMNEPVTRLPIHVFRVLRDGRHLRERWPDLRIVLDGTGPESARTIVIPGRQIVRDVTGEPEMLTVRQQNTNQSVVTIGQDALRAFFVLRDFNSGLLQTRARVSERNLTVLQTVALVFLWPLFFYWKLVKPIFRLSPVFMERHPAMAIIHIMLDGITILFPFLFFFQRGTGRALLGDPFLAALLGVSAVISSAWLALCLINLIMRGSEFHGIFGSEFAKFDGRVQPASVRRAMGHDPSAAHLDLPTRYRIGRALIVHQWARDVNILLGVVLVLLAISPDTLRGLGFSATYIFLFCSTGGALLSSAVFSGSQFSALWLSWLASSVAVFVLTVLLFGVRVIAPLGELIHNYFEVEAGFFIAIFFLVVLILTIQFERGRVRTLELWVEQTAARKHD